MSEQFDRSYFDARFDGLEKLMQSNQDNTKEHIIAVSSNVKRLESDFSEHRENTEAHGAKASSGAISSIVAWLGLAVASILVLLEIRKH